MCFIAKHDLNESIQQDLHKDGQIWYKMGSFREFLLVGWLQKSSFIAYRTSTYQICYTNPSFPPFSYNQDLMSSPSALGTVDHWDSVYQREFANYKDNKDNKGDVWYGEKAESDAVNYYEELWTDLFGNLW